MFTKISKIARFFVLVLFFTIGLLYVIFRSQPVQTWIVDKLSRVLSEEIGCQVRVGSVDIDFFKTGVLESVYVEDQKGDTLFYIQKLKIDYHTYDKTKRIIKLNYVGIEGGKILFGEHQGDSVLNYEFFIDYFNSGQRDPNKPKIIWTIYSKVVELENMRFDFFNRNEEKPDFMDFNYNDMSFRQIHAEIKDFYLIDDSLHFQVNHLETVEKCGFVVSHIAADTKIHEGGLEFRNLTLMTPNSSITDEFIMETKDWKDYNDFNNLVMLKANLKKSELHSKDLWYFSNNLKSWETTIKISGSGSGFLNRLKGKQTVINLYEHTEYQGDWTLTGLPDFDNTILDFEVKSFVTDFKDLNKLSLNNIPANFVSLGKIKYSGMFSGFYNDFITYGKIDTDIGSFQSDINIKFKEGLEKAVYSGVLKTSLFRIKSFIPQAQIEEVAFDVNVNGKGLSRETYDMTVDGVVPLLKFGNYTFHDITAKGVIRREYFAGHATVRDQALNLDFDGEFRSDKLIPEAHFKALVHEVNLRKLGLDSINQKIKGNFVLDFVGHSLDEAEGSIIGEDVVVERNNQRVSIPYINLSAYEYAGGIKELKLRSDLVDAYIKGQFRLDLLDVSILHLLHQLIPSYFNKPTRSLPNEDFVFEIDLKRPYDITSLYMPQLQLEPCVGGGFYKSHNQTLKFNLSNGLVMYNDYVFKNISISAIKEIESDLKMKIELDDFYDEKIFKTRNIHIDATVFRNVAEFNINALDTGLKIGISSAGRFDFVKDSIFLQMTDVELSINQKSWKLDTNAQSIITADKYSFDHFIFRNENQLISLDGELGLNSEEKLTFQLNAFQLNTVNYFTKDLGIPLLGGLSNGNVLLTIKDGQNYFHSDLKVKDFTVSGDTLGDLSVLTRNRVNSSLQHLKIHVDKGLLDSLKIEGNIDYKSTSRNLYLFAQMPPSNLRVFQPYLKDVMTGLKGQFYTKDSVKISGTFNKPIVEGEVLIRDAEVVVDYLKIPIKFSANIQSDAGKLSILPFTFYDDKNNSGRAKGYVFHNSFSDFKLNLNIYELNNFHLLNTGKNDNSLYYGQGYASGNATFIGPFDDLDILVNAKTMPGTKFYLPISEGDASLFPSYAHFKTIKKKQAVKKEVLPLHSLELNIEATNEADVEIIFDEILGDKIKGTGSGNLKMEMTKSGDFYMFGTYTVDRGDYLFTAFDLYNKPLQIKQGGTITWYGDPLDAKLDLIAYNEQQADPTPLLTAVTASSNINAANSTTNSAQVVTVESELYLKGNLFSPEISFGLNFPKLQSETGNFTSSLSPVISRIKSDKEEVNRQVFSLLLMKKFLPPLFAQSELAMNNAGSNALSSAGSDLLTSQLSNWLNRIDPNWRVNVIYKNGTPSLPAEYRLILSRKFLNEKLTIDGSFSNYSTNPNINLEYKVTKKGNIKIKAYTRSSFNQVNTTSLSTPITTNGVGIVYTKEFNVVWWLRWLVKKNKNKKKAVNQP